MRVQTKKTCLSMFSWELIAALAVVMVPVIGAGADEPKSPQIVLSSGYARNLFVFGKRVANSMNLTATLDDKGTGKGTLIFNGNSWILDRSGNGVATTLMTYEVLKVSFEQTKDKKGLYEIIGHSYEVRFFLVIPPKGTTTYRLVVADKRGTAQELFLLEGSPGFPAEDRKKREKLTLWSGYFLKETVSGKGRSPYSVRLTATLNDKGGGEGTLEFDPNRKSFDLNGIFHRTTLMSIASQKVTLEQSKDDQGLYEIRVQNEIEGKRPDTRFFLVLPRKGATTHRLVIADREGKPQEVLPLEGESP